MSLSAFLDSIEPRKLSELSQGEIYWRDHHDWLNSCGYRFRPRFRPGWIKSWEADPRKYEWNCEDVWDLNWDDVVDAVRISDNYQVTLKKVDKNRNPFEAQIAGFFTALEPSPANHCVPILETLCPFNEENITILVMPLLRKYDSPRFDTFGEALEFFRQIFEGLQFMHHHNIAHRDCNANNIMMDGAHLYPRGFHPDHYHQHLRPSGRSTAPHYTRTRLPVKYYFINFGIFREYKPPGVSLLYDSANARYFDEIIVGGDKSVPEFNTVPKQRLCDPFAVDIYYLGNMIRQQFLDGFPGMRIYGRHGFEFMRPLVNDMIQADPTKRPQIDEVVTRFAEIQKGFSTWKLRSRVILVSLDSIRCRTRSCCTSSVRLVPIKSIVSIYA
ncbi:hypothetical protein DFH06DRAFT_1315695 [Mycena polygramma]|nr:hypothetical protein DFH06DRAFT_1315695 [Mycena polygramma]